MVRLGYNCEAADIAWQMDDSGFPYESLRPCLSIAHSGQHGRTWETCQLMKQSCSTLDW